MKQVSKWLFCVLCMSILAAKASDLDALEKSSQCLVVTTYSWAAAAGTMSIFERDAKSPWQQRGASFTVVVGKTGLAWGRGIISTKFEGPMKKEGDNKAPAGIFRLSRVFGYAQTANTKMPYLALTPSIVGVDDPRSRYYNQLIDTAKIDKRDWRTAEEMFLKDHLYKWGVVVDNNSPARPGAGSCIFLHIWRTPETPTVGCTAMSEQNLVDLIRWLDPTREPLLIQLPRPDYDRLNAKRNLPPLR